MMCTVRKKLPTYGVTLTPGTRFITYSAATMAFGLPTSAGLKEIDP
jgi:hypothetical protein